MLRRRSGTTKAPATATFRHDDDVSHAPLATPRWRGLGGGGGTRQPAEQLADRRLGRLEVLAPHRPDVDLQRAPFGHDVWPRPARDDTDVDGHAIPATVQRVEPPDQIRCGEDRATP